MIIFFGDIHGQWNLFNSKVNELYSKYKEPMTIIICGDVAYFWKGEDIPKVKVPPYSKVIWAPGNHEDWETIDSYELGRLHEVQDNVFLASFGAIEEIEGKKILFCGGADSVDKNMRTPFLDWFPSEIITNKDMDFLLDNVKDQKIDILVSHTCPERVYNQLQNEIDWMEVRSKDPSVYALDMIVEKFRPDFSIFGHFHRYKEGNVGDLHWTCLSYINSSSRYYKILKT